MNYHHQLYNKIRLSLFSLTSFNKIFRNYHRKYEINVINQLYNIHNIHFLLDEKIIVYIISKEGLKENELKRINTQRDEKIYLMTQEIYYKVKAIKLIIKNLLDYNIKLAEYEIYLKHKINNILISLKNFRDLYMYISNIYSNENYYNYDFENLLEEFSV